MPNNDYDFIMNPDAKRAGPTLAGPQKLLAIVGIFAVVIVAVIVIFSLVFSSSSGSDRQSLVNVIAHATEVNRVIELGLKDVDDIELKQRLQTLNTVVLSDLQEADAIGASRGYKIERIERLGQRDATLEETIDDAIDARELDATLQAAVSEAAGEYFTALTNARSATTATAETQLYASAIAGLQLITNTPN